MAVVAMLERRLLKNPEPLGKFSLLPAFDAAGRASWWRSFESMRPWIFGNVQRAGSPRGFPFIAVACFDCGDLRVDETSIAQ